MKTREQAIEDMKSVMHHFRHAVKAGAKGNVSFAILAVHADGSGDLIASVEAPEFFEDLALVIGAPPSTAEDEMDAKVTQFIDGLGRKNTPQAS